MACSKGAATFFLVGLAICSAHLASAQKWNVSSERRFKQNILDTLLNPNSYKKDVIPGDNKTGSGPTKVELNVNVRRISVVDIPEGQLKVQLTLTQRWNDPRLAYSHPAANEKQIKFILVQEQNKIWTPELFVSNEMEANVPKLFQSKPDMRIFPNGDVLWSVRASLTLACPMRLKPFPFDTQICSIKFTVQFKDKDIVLKWKKHDPVEVTSDFNMQHFSLLSICPERCDHVTNFGTYSCLRVDFELKRMIGYYLIQVFIPGTMFVILGYLVFFLAPKDIIARVILVVAAGLALATECSRKYERFPVASYTMAIDVWTGVTLTSVFIALIETLGVNLLSRRESENGRDGAGVKVKGNREANAAGEAYEDLEMEALTRGTDKEKGDEKRKRYWRRNDQQLWSQKTDMLFRIVYPVSFALFTLIYSTIVYSTS